MGQVRARLAMRTLAQLAESIDRIDGRSYRAYKDLEGSYRADNFELHIDHVQGDPFAAPSRLRAFVPHHVSGIDAELRERFIRRVAIADFLARVFSNACRDIEQRRGSGRSGMIAIDTPGQEVLERTACQVDDSGVELRFTVGLPASGRRVLGRQARALLLEDVPDALMAATSAASIDHAALAHHAGCVEDSDTLRAQLRDQGLVAFIADGAMLPRRSGIDPRPMLGHAVPVESPEALRVTLTRANGEAVSGLGIRAGVSLIVGGGYHGKSTLLAAIELGIYDHRPGDGRELVVSDWDTVRIRAEDGRSIASVDISPFIDNLPGGRDTARFCSEDASGSTSQAANVVEALEAGARVLLIDEDTAATNFMIRDGRMQQLIAKDKEPITPFVDKVRQLYDEHGVSTVIVVGGSGDYFDVADWVIAMEDYVPRDVTARAKEIAEQPTDRRIEGGDQFGQLRARVPIANSLDPSKGRRASKIGARDCKAIQFGEYDVDLSGVGALVARSQLVAIGHALDYARSAMRDGATVGEVLDAIDAVIDDRGLDGIARQPTGDRAQFRRFELAAALNHLRSLRIK